MRLVLFLSLALVVASARAESDTMLRGQSTYVWQGKPPFGALYSGERSLRAERERSYSLTGTAFLGARVARATEVYFNPEVALGLPFSDLTGLGGFSNGELARTSGRNPTFYRARAFIRHTIGFGGGSETIEVEDNQLAGTVDRERLVITFGNVSALDLFDDARYAKDPRTQFQNWAHFAPGAWDYPADSRGYSWGLAAEYVTSGWTLRAGRFLMPKQSNGLALNRRFMSSYGDAIEWERRHRWGEHEGALRLLAFRNRARMASFDESVADGGRAGATPSLDTSRVTRTKYGFAVSGDQALARDLGVFTRLSWADGRSETFAFTEIDRSYSAGAVLQGERWGRARDALGVALTRNEISRARRAYLGAGGVGFFIGDGRLTYAPEWIAEAYYSIAVWKTVALSLNAQRIVHPAYNADRGPVTIYGMRVHASF
jgi:high affinity Mn2+ porin